MELDKYNKLLSADVDVSERNDDEQAEARAERPLTGSRQWKDLYAAIAGYAKELKNSRNR